jgi:hypothetical protein
MGRLLKEAGVVARNLTQPKLTRDRLVGRRQAPVHRRLAFRHTGLTFALEPGIVAAIGPGLVQQDFRLWSVLLDDRTQVLGIRPIRGQIKAACACLLDGDKVPLFGLEFSDQADSIAMMAARR